MPRGKKNFKFIFRIGAATTEANMYVKLWKRRGSIVNVYVRGVVD